MNDTGRLNILVYIDEHFDFSDLEQKFNQTVWEKIAPIFMCRKTFLNSIYIYHRLCYCESGHRGLDGQDFCDF